MNLLLFHEAAVTQIMQSSMELTNGKNWCFFSITGATPACFAIHVSLSRLMTPTMLNYHVLLLTWL